ncbi:MAG: pseudaminic acid synthase [Proteobacteria bacterium]|nr:MAG: pseudaminic acid synthase [Pseudomonadota bacterium]PIE67507.1 MAG: pseudaminic acid synthase [Deltaproteobacteria bacterium]
MHKELQTIQIGHRPIGPGHPVYIVAEISANHRQDYNEAAQLIHAAKEAGADAVKLQTYTPDTMTIDCKSEHFCHGEGSLWENKSLYELYQTAYMPWEWQPRLKEVAEKIDIDFFSTAFDRSSVEFLETMGVPAYKIASFELIDLPLIQQVAKTGKPLFLSTGMATMEEIEKAVRVANGSGADQIVLLKCTSSYPAGANNMNLKTLTHMADHFGYPCGLSDHSLGHTCAIAAVALGAMMIEKHFTLSRRNNSADSGFSAEPAEFKAMVESIRTVEMALGKATYGPNPSEAESLKFRRSLYVVADVAQGERLTADNVRSIRPGQGLAPEYMDRIIGKKANQPIKRGTPLAWCFVG